MDSPSSDRLPFELWTHILEDAISFDGNMALQATCSPETYISFKMTCRYTRSRMELYHLSVDIKGTLRLVCRAWNSILGHWRYESRWIILSPVLKSAETHIQWHLPLRADLEEDVRFHFTPNSDLLDVMRFRSRLWRTWDPLPNGPIRLVRLELLNIRKGVYPEIIDDLCTASSNLGSLRSLAIRAHSPSPWVLDIVSQSFPHLTHFTLVMSFDKTDQVTPYHPTDSSVTGKGVLILYRLEVLCLHPLPGTFDLTNWNIPRLHTFHSVPFIRRWEDSIYPLLQRYSSRLETLDLDEVLHGFGALTPERHSFALPVGFWGHFPHLRLLRIDLKDTIWTEFPKNGHPLEWLVHPRTINHTFDFVATLELWARHWAEGGQLKICISGRFADRISAHQYGLAVTVILRDLKKNGTKLQIMESSRIAE